MPGYFKFMREFFTMKSVVIIDWTNHVHYFYAISTRSFVQMKEDSYACTIPCTVGSIKFAKCLVWSKGPYKPDTSFHIQETCVRSSKTHNYKVIMSNSLVKWPLDILCNVLLKVDVFIILAHFLIMDCKVDLRVSVISGRPCNKANVKTVVATLFNIEGIF